LSEWGGDTLKGCAKVPIPAGMGNPQHDGSSPS
jgi:hypothetical protein